MQCACDVTAGDTPSGCADICDKLISGTPNDNFCNGASALTQCAQCIQERCGQTWQTCTE